MTTLIGPRGGPAIPSGNAPIEIDLPVADGLCDFSKLKDVAQKGALEALAASRPGRRQPSRDHELDDARAEVERLRMALAEMAVKLTLAEGKEPWG